jgi:hypothetical protein
VTDPGALAAEIQLLRSQLEALKERRARLRTDGEAMTAGRGMDRVREEVARVRAQVAATGAALAEAKEKAAASQAAMVSLEQAVKQRESALLGERDRKNVLRLIPERTQTSKEPVLVLVTGAGLALQRFDAGEVVRVQRTRQFRDALEQFSSPDQYLVLYFKPSGAGRFDDLTEAAREAGFEIGYDAIPEEFEIEFRSTPVPAPVP